ncbi:MAG: histidine kinase [Ignavibacteriae bacterium]|nr:histidine kinase [Ignavibacteriota bacterium]
MLRTLGGSLAVFCTCLAAAQAQEWTVLRSYTTRDGLSQNVVNCGLQDSKGFLWIGTRYGLNRFDGRVFRAYHRHIGDSTSLVDEEVSCLVEDAKGAIWVGTRRGLCVYQRGNDRFRRIEFTTHVAEREPRPAVLALNITQDGVVWVGTSLGVFHVLPGSIRAVEMTGFRIHVTSNFAIHGVTPLDERRTIIASNRGLFTTLGIRLSPDAPIIRSDVMSSSARCGDSLLLFGHYGDTALVAFDVRTYAVDPVAIVGQEHRVRVWPKSFISTGEENIIAVTNLGLFEYTRLLRRRHGLSCEATHFFTGQVNGVFLDEEGRLYACTTQGLVVLTHSRPSYTNFALFPDVIRRRFDNTVRTLHVRRDGTVCAGSIYGLHILNSRRSFVSLCASHLGPEWGHGYNDVVNGIEDTGGDTLFLAGRGLRSYDARTGHVRQVATGLSSKAATWCSTQTELGHFLGSLRGGIFVLDGRHRVVRQLESERNDPRTLSSNEIHDFYRDTRGHIWIATNGGVNRWRPDDSSFVRYEHDPRNARSIGDNRVWAIIEDTRGWLWVGTYGGGIARYRPATDDFERVTEEDGLPSNAVVAMVSDLRGRLWITTETGLVCYDPSRRTWRSFEEPEVPQFQNFGFKAAARTASGELVFGSAAGIVRFHPDSLRWDTQPPRVLISDVRLRERSICAELHDGDTLTVTHSDNMLAFTFAALDFSHPQRNCYTYALDGFTRGWISLGRQRDAVFTNLDPGTYVLRVRASNADGIWTPRGIAVTIVVLPPLHATWWFRLLMVLAIVGAAGAVVFVRLRIVKDRARMERRVVESELQSLRLQMNPHFIFNSLNAVQSFMLTAEYAQANSYLTKFARLIRTILEHSRVSTVRIGDELDFLSSYMELERLRFSDRFRWEMTVDASVNRDLYIPSMLVQPHVENAIRHGLAHRHGGGLLGIHVATHDGHLTITVRDNGIGRARAAALREERGVAQSSLGVSVTAERLAILQAHGFPGARLDIEDLVDDDGKAAGTTVTLVVPVVPPRAPRILAR